MEEEASLSISTISILSHDVLKGKMAICSMCLFYVFCDIFVMLLALAKWLMHLLQFVVSNAIIAHSDRSQWCTTTQNPATWRGFVLPGGTDICPTTTARPCARCNRHGTLSWNACHGDACIRQCSEQKALAGLIVRLAYNRVFRSSQCFLSHIFQKSSKQ